MRQFVRCLFIATLIELAWNQWDSRTAEYHQFTKAKIAKHSDGTTGILSINSSFLFEISTHLLTAAYDLRHVY
jgi:hypothetical protein